VLIHRRDDLSIIGCWFKFKVRSLDKGFSHILCGGGDSLDKGDNGTVRVMM